MAIENRTRVEIFLPVRSDLSAYQIALDWLGEEFAFARGGSTFTTPFAGLYATSTQAELIHDAVRILFCDIDLDTSVDIERLKLADYLKGTRNFLMELLEEEDVWIVFHPVSRIVS